MRIGINDIQTQTHSRAPSLKTAKKTLITSLKFSGLEIYFETFLEECSRFREVAYFQLYQRDSYMTEKFVPLFWIFNIMF